MCSWKCTTTLFATVVHHLWPFSAFLKSMHAFCEASSGDRIWSRWPSKRKLVLKRKTLTPKCSDVATKESYAPASHPRRLATHLLKVLSKKWLTKLAELLHVRQLALTRWIPLFLACIFGFYIWISCWEPECRNCQGVYTLCHHF